MSLWRGSKSNKSQPRPDILDLRAPSKSKQAKPTRYGWLWLSLATIFAVVIGGLIIAYTKASSKPKPANSNGPSVNQVVDDPNGLKFAVPKELIVINSTDLKKLSPLFIYGYRVADVDNVHCIISQSPRTNSTTVTPDILAAGTYAQLKTIYPDIQSVGYQPIALVNGRSAAEIIVSYHQNGDDIKQVEVVSTTDTKTTFAFCTSPMSLYSFYLPKFDSFFKSLQVY